MVKNNKLFPSLSNKYANNRKVLVVLVAAHASWLVAALCWQHFFNGDSYEYIYLSENIINGWYYAANPVLPIVDYGLSTRPPVYSLLIASVYLLLGKSILPLIVLQSIISIISCHTIYCAISKYAKSKKWTNWYLLFICTFPAQFVFSNIVEPDIVFQLFIVLYLKFLLKYFENAKWQNFLAMALWLSLASLTKPITYPYTLLQLIFGIILVLSKKDKKIIIGAAIPLLVMVLYGTWNYSRTGLYHISSIQSHNLLSFNAKWFLAQKHGTAYSDSVINGHIRYMAHLPDLKSKYNYAGKAANDIIYNDFTSYLIYHLKNSVKYFFDPGKSELDLFTGYMGYYFRPDGTNFYMEIGKHGWRGGMNYLKTYPWLPIILVVFFMNMLRFVGCLVFVLSRRRPIALRLAFLFFIAYFALITGPVANTRYMLPLLPLMAAMAALTFSEYTFKK
ncbi:MAG: glycosyltransferase family 39 protein [Edaphocola sp.]